MDTSSPDPKPAKKLPILRLVLVAIAVVELVILFRSLNLQEYLRDALVWIDSLGAIAPVVFVATYTIATVLFVPGTLLTLGAGIVFGLMQGSIYTFIGATLGATAAFLVGRYLARGWVEGQIQGNEKFRAVDGAVSQEGLKIVLLTRLSPFFPFNLLNYAYGVTGVSLRDYFFGCVGMIPGTVMYVYFGTLAGNIATLGTAGQAETPSSLRLALLTVGLIATVALVVYITQVARQVLNQTIAQTQVSDPPPSLEDL